MHGGRERGRRPPGRFKRREPTIPMEKKVELFILRNSQNGYFTKFSTITTKFNITESETWDVVGMLLSEGRFESVHDPTSGEMKLCEADMKHEIMEKGRRRKFEPQDRTGEVPRGQNHNKDRKGMRRGGSRTPNRRGGGRGAGSGRDRGHVSREGPGSSENGDKGGVKKHASKNNHGNGSKQAPSQQTTS